MRISRIYRLLRLITMLQSNRAHTVQQLANELEVSRRTVFRDLNILEMARIPYHYHPEQQGYRISQHFFLPPVNLTLTEALAVLGITGRLQTTGNVPLQAEAARAAVKLESVLPREISQYVGQALDKLSIHLAPVTDHQGPDDIFDRLAAAVIDRRVCRLTYQSYYEDQTIQTTIRPLRMVFVDRAWYVIAYSQLHEEIRTFKLVRFRKFAVTKRQFDEPEGVDLASYFGDAWRMIPEGRLWDVQLHFEKLVAGNVAEVRWHRNQRIEWNADGSMEFHVRVDGLGEITWWLLGYGDQVTVVSPPELRQRVAGVSRRVLARYEQEHGAPTGGKKPQPPRRPSGRKGGAS